MDCKKYDTLKKYGSVKNNLIFVASNKSGSSKS
jgi:hypothetical protein